MPSASPRTLVAIATYNEIENVPPLVDAVLQHAPDVDILIIDDNSPDGTGRWCEKQRQAEPRLRCLHRERKLGLGTALVGGFRYALEHGYGRVITMDGDFSHDPAYLPDLIAAMNPPDGPAADVVIGSRYVAGGGIQGWPLHRKLMSSVLNRYARLLLGLKSRDCSGGFRCYRCEPLQQIDFDRLRSHGYSFLEEILWELERRGARIAETPIQFVDRKHGASKINLSEAFSALWLIFRLGCRSRLGW